MSSISPVVLLTNDDGPPNQDFSPFVLGLYLHLTQQLGWEVKVVLPSSQKSWIGKAFHIKDIVRGNYFYPKSDGTGDVSRTSRPLKSDELGEWILLDGTPASCANIALHNIYPDQIDLVISGPNYGRNTSSAFALSSGTVGSALSASLSKKPSIAVSYGVINFPPPPSHIDPANKLACRIISHLWHNWGTDELGLRPGQVDLYNVNIPLIDKIVSDDGLKVYWTNLWRSSYRSLFSNPSDIKKSEDPFVEVPEENVLQNLQNCPLSFAWYPAIDHLLNPHIDSIPVGTDTWALCHESASITPLRASFAEPNDGNAGCEWKTNF